MKLPIAQKSWSVLIPSLVVATGLLFFNFALSIPFWIVFLFILSFFRDPERVSLETDSAILSPADGKIIYIGKSETEKDLTSHHKISIFMNVFNVHVNRAPINGKVIAVKHSPGLFRPAYEDLASSGNERIDITFKTGIGVVLVRLIAGLIARRIVSYIRPDDEIQRGERMSLIKFGSRVDIYLPDSVNIEVGIGDKVKAGKTRIGTIIIQRKNTSYEC